mmetsp:Transcript_9478/g.17199  ORF Transcript_9478/g.17199 Transcript_9478/m.17199 type:complete len:105 (-) Transcript_9478:139-453(-)
MKTGSMPKTILSLHACACAGDCSLLASYSDETWILTQTAPHSFALSACYCSFALLPFEACDTSFKWTEYRNDDDSVNNNYFVFLSVILFFLFRLFELLFLHFSC